MGVAIADSVSFLALALAHMMTLGVMNGAHTPSYDILIALGT